MRIGQECLSGVKGRAVSAKLGSAWTCGSSDLVNDYGLLDSAFSVAVTSFQLNTLIIRSLTRWPYQAVPLSDGKPRKAPWVKWQGSSWEMPAHSETKTAVSK